MSRSGQRPGPLDGDTPQAEALAAWLRRLTNDLTVRELQERFTYGRTQWSDFRMGRKLIPSWLLDDLVQALVPEPQLREVKRKEGRKLLAEAEQAALGKIETPPPQAAQGSAVELELRLDEARRGQLQAQESLMGTTQIVYRLLNMVSSLQTRCAVLEGERDRAVAEARTQVLAEIGYQLTESQQRLEQAEDRLTRARREREEAENLRVGAAQLAEQLRRATEALDRLQDESGPEQPETGPEPGARAGLLPLYEYDQLLEQTDEELDAHAARMSNVREHMGLKPRDDGNRDDFRVVRGQLADTTDKPLNSINAADDTGQAVSADSADTPAAPANPRPFETSEVTPRTNAAARRTTSPAAARRISGLAFAVLSLLPPAVAASGYRSAFNTEPGPAVWKLVVYGLAAVAVALIGWFLAFIPCSVLLGAGKDTMRWDEWVAAMLTVLGFVVAIILGLTAPAGWLGPIESWGRTWTNTVGLTQAENTSTSKQQPLPGSETFRLGTDWVDLDATPPLQTADTGGDVYLHSVEGASAVIGGSNSAALVSGSQRPSQSACADLVRRSAALFPIPVPVERRFCLTTMAQHTVLITIKAVHRNNDTPNKSYADATATIWKTPTTVEPDPEDGSRPDPVP